MISIRETKKKAKYALKKNYWRSVAIVFFISIILGNFSINSVRIQNNISSVAYNYAPRVINSINSEIAKETIEKVTKIKTNFSTYKPTRGILANIFNNITNSGSFIFGLLNSFNQLIFHERIWASLIILLGAILSFLYWLLIRNVLLVGQARFFLENKNHKKTNFKRIFMPYKVKKIKNVSIAMMCKTMQEWLWYLTIIGGFIKHYSYALVPYILAENPKIKGSDAIKLSKDMMHGHKWELFKLDLSLIGWYILDILSFHLIGILFTSPYKMCCMAEVYMNIRREAKEKKIKNAELLMDDLLLEINDKYPIEKYIYKERSHKWLNTDYNKNYSIDSLILMFFVASIIGWIWEVGLHLFQYGSFVNRGTLHGPWLHIYGWGLILLLILLKKTRNKPILTFCFAILICGTLEYGTAWYLETFKNARWWDYDGFFLNIHGRICLEGLIVFGIGGCAFIYFAAPFLDSIFNKISKKIKILLCLLLTLFYVSDLLYSSKHPNTGEGISQNFAIKENIIMKSQL